MDDQTVLTEVRAQHEREISDIRDSLEKEHEEKMSSLEENHAVELEQLKLSLLSNGRDLSGDSGQSSAGQGEGAWGETERAEHQRGWEANRETEKEDLARFEDQLSDFQSEQLEQLENVKVAIKVSASLFYKLYKLVVCDILFNSSPKRES